MPIIRYKGENYTGSQNDTSGTEFNYDSGDELEPEESAEVPQLANKETLKSFAQKVSLAVKNVRYLLKMRGNTDISTIGDGTTTGAIKSLKDGMTKVKGNAETEYRAGNVNLTPENIGAVGAAGGIDFKLGVENGLLYYEEV